MANMFAACLFLLLTLTVPLSQQELFTALVDLERLIDTEKYIVTAMDAYLEEEEERILKLRHFRENYVKMDTPSQDAHSFLANPVNAYILVKRLTTDWKIVQKLMHSDATIAKSTDSNLTFPSTEDLSGAVDALLRLQDTYHLDTSNLAAGRIAIGRESKELQTESSEQHTKLTASDCFELGRHSYTKEDYYHTHLWMQEALEKFEEEQFKTISKSDVLEYLAFANFKEGNIRKALSLTNLLLEIIPDHDRGKGNKIWYESMIDKKSTKRKKGDEGDDVPVDENIKENGQFSDEPRERSEREQYEALCRGEKVISPLMSSKLNCFYFKTHGNYLKYAHIKAEEVFKKPLILIFHDILSENEMAEIKSLASGKLRRATVQNFNSGVLEFATYRISKSAWLSSMDNPLAARISQRIEDIIGLTTKTAEELQVVNYGIGGHYEPHYDFARKGEGDAFKSLGTGNRIATWLNYMSDVEAGGATVFPILGVGVRPKKGSAAFWYNLHKNGEGDLLTRHAGCPVLVGNKWVSNKWFHERGQEFLRPCKLTNN